MAVTLTHVKTAAQRGIPPEECLLEVNRVLVREKVSSMFTTCFYGILNTRSGELHYCNAGHNPPYLLRASGAVDPVAEVGGLPLGMFGKLPYTGACAHLAPGDAIFLYTDGVTEGNNAALDDFSGERLIEALRAVAPLDCRGMVEQVTAKVLAFTTGAPQSDDITMVSVRLAGAH